MDNVSETKVADAIALYKTAIASMKKATITFINSIEEIPVKRIGGENSGCFSVSASTVMSNNFILSPFYYDVKKQKETLIELVEKSRDFEFIKVITEIAENGKRVIRSGGSSYHQIYAPNVVSALKTFIKEEDVHV